MIEHGLCTTVERKNGFLRFGLDRLGAPDGEGGGDLMPSLYPYGFSGAPHEAERGEDGLFGDGAGLLTFPFGGGDEGALPVQDPRVEAPDHGRGGAAMYGGPLGSAPSYVFIAGSDGKVRVSAPETVIGADAAAKSLVKEQLLMQWITSVLIPALSIAPGGPITVSPPSGLGTTKLRSE